MWIIGGKIGTLTLLLMLGIYALNLVDANVDAHLSGFDISEDLTLKIAPQIGTLSASSTRDFLSHSNSSNEHCTSRIRKNGQANR